MSEHTPSPDPRQHFFDKPKNTKRFFLAFYLFCAVMFLFDLVDWIGKSAGIEALNFRQHYTTFPAEDWPGFFSLYAFVGIVVLVLGSKLLRKIVMRDEDYYDE